MDGFLNDSTTRRKARTSSQDVDKVLVRILESIEDLTRETKRVSEIVHYISSFHQPVVSTEVDVSDDVVDVVEEKPLAEIIMDNIGENRGSFFDSEDIASWEQVACHSEVHRLEEILLTLVSDRSICSFGNLYGIPSK